MIEDVAAIKYEGRLSHGLIYLVIIECVNDQIIFAIKGDAQLVTFSSIDTIDNKSAKLAVDKSINLEEGQAVLIPSGTLHWHGASKSKKSSQISIMKNGKTFWF